MQPRSVTVPLSAMIRVLQGTVLLTQNHQRQTHCSPLCFSGNALVSINVVTLHQARLVPGSRGWVTTRTGKPPQRRTRHSGQLSLGHPLVGRRFEYQQNWGLEAHHVILARIRGLTVLAAWLVNIDQHQIMRSSSKLEAVVVVQIEVCFTYFTYSATILRLLYSGSHIT